MISFPQNIKTEHEKQGYFGEQLVKSYYEKEGFLVYENPDKYGSWDLIIVNKISGKSFTVQVKTMVRYIVYNYYGIKCNSETLDNLKLCDKLIIVTRNPNSINDEKWKGKVLEVLNHKNFTLKHKEYIIPSIDKNFKELFKLSDEQLISLNSFKTYNTEFNG